ncbi:MAG: hypothetical protein ACRD09_08060 [Vicinamibacterales bacterium]
MVFLLAALTPAAAQEEPSTQPPAGNLTPAEIARLLDAYVLVQAQESLRLTDAQYGQFVSRMKVVQDVRRRNQQGRQRILQELGRLSGDPNQPVTDEGALRERLKALAEHEERAAVELRQAYEGLDSVLDLRQRARFRIFEERMERQKFELLMRARQANRAQRPNTPRRIPQL